MNLSLFVPLLVAHLLAVNLAAAGPLAGGALLAVMKHFEATLPLGRYEILFLVEGTLRLLSLGGLPLRFREARETDWHSDYRAYLEQFPSGEHAAAARERLAWLAGRKAVPEIVVSAVVDADDGDVNAPGPRWRWTTQLYERGGQIGYRVSGQGFILDPRGGLWMGENDARIPRPRIRVEAGGSARDTYWISSRPHLLCNGVAIFTWEGEDAGGHPIRLEERIQLRHLNCPGPTPAR
ncbi:MAG TPA: hypothetical protein PKN80_07880 [bacterium]|nr:hypothetical protein [bacterium]